MTPTAFDPVAYLLSKGMSGKRTSTGEWTYPCFLLCGEPQDSRKRKLYINERSGLGHCKVCESAVGPVTLQRHFGDGDTSQPVDLNTPQWQALETATEVGQVMLTGNDEMMLYLLNERGLTPDTIHERRLGWIGGNWSLIGSTGMEHKEFYGTGLVYEDGPRRGKDFFYNHLLIPYYDHRLRVVQLRGRVMGDHAGGKYMTGAGQKVKLYGRESLVGADEVIVCEGEFDAMLLRQHLQSSTDPRLQNMAVVALPGANAVPEGFDSMLADCRRVFLGFDADEVGMRAAEHLRAALGPRAKVISWPDADVTAVEKLDWTSWFVELGRTVADVEPLLRDATGSRRITTIAEAGESWRNRPLDGGLKIGIRGFDHLIKPGFLPGQVVVVLAKTGTGKTIFLCNLAYSLRDQPVLFVTLEMTAEEVYERMRRIFLFHEPRASDADVERGLSNLWIADTNRIKTGGLESLIDEYEVETGVRPEAVLVDYLGYFAKGQDGGSPYEKTTNAAMELKAVAKGSRVVIISPHQVNRGARPGRPIEDDDARDSGGVEETADFLLALWRPDDVIDEALDAQPNGRVVMGVLKSRHGGKGRQFTLQMDLLTLAMVDLQEPTARLAQQHNQFFWRGGSYEDLRNEQTRAINIPLSEESPL